MTARDRSRSSRSGNDDSVIFSLPSYTTHITTASCSSSLSSASYYPSSCSSLSPPRASCKSHSIFHVSCFIFILHPTPVVPSKTPHFTSLPPGWRQNGRMSCASNHLQPQASSSFMLSRFFALRTLGLLSMVTPNATYCECTWLHARQKWSTCRVYRDQTTLATSKVLIPRFFL